MSKPLIVANWKMNTTLADANVLATLVRNRLHEIDGVDAVLCPPYIWLQEVASVLEISAPHIYLGAQNCYPEAEGAYTGEVSVAMLKDLCSFVIVGHSERRAHFGESGEFVNDKVHAVLQSGMTPIVCVGEKTKQEGSIAQVLAELKTALGGIKSEDYSKIVVAYEPIWAISANSGGVASDSDYTERVCAQIKHLVGKETRVLYGGSVNASNVEDFLRQSSIDGALVGAASLKANEFISICEKAR